MSCRLKLRQLESHLEDVDAFEQPKILLEQYPTRAHIAASMLHTMQASFGDIENRKVSTNFSLCVCVYCRSDGNVGLSALNESSQTYEILPFLQARCRPRMRLRGPVHWFGDARRLLHLRLRH